MLCVLFCFVGCGESEIDWPDISYGSSISSTQGTNSVTSNNETENNSSESEEADTNTIGTEFKAAMDSYEKFMNDYVAFLKKYEANPNDLSLLSDYAKYMSDYAEVVEDFEKWEDEELNDAELTYYVEVQSRVTKKLLEVS